MVSHEGFASVVEVLDHFLFDVGGDGARGLEDVSGGVVDAGGGEAGEESEGDLVDELCVVERAVEGRSCFFLVVDFVRI